MRWIGSGANLTIAAVLALRCVLALLPPIVVGWPPSAAAQSSVFTLYTPVTIKRRAPSHDESFNAFRQRLAAVAKRRVYAELAPLVASQDFFWDRDYDYRFDPRKPAVDNLATAIALERGNGVGWERLAEFATEAATEPLGSRPGVVCAPAGPDFDIVAFSKLLETTYTEAIDWAYPRVDETVVRAAPKADAPAIGKLGPAFVQFKGFSGVDSETGRSLNEWARLTMPDGKEGFVAPGSLLSLATAKLCYIKDQVRGWRIIGYIGGSN